MLATTQTFSVRNQALATLAALANDAYDSGVIARRWWDAHGVDTVIQSVACTVAFAIVAYRLAARAYTQAKPFAIAAYRTATHWVAVARPVVTHWALVGLIGAALVVDGLTGFFLKR